MYYICLYLLSGPTNTKPHCCPEQGPFFDPNHRCPLECGAASTASNQVIHGPILYILKQLPLSVSLNASSDRLLNLLQVQISYYWIACAAFFERPIFYRFEDLLLADLTQFIMSGGSILRKVEHIYLLVSYLIQRVIRPMDT